MTTLEVILSISTAVFALAYYGACDRAQRWKNMAGRSLDQTEKALAGADNLRSLLRLACASNERLLRILAVAVAAIKKHDDEGEEWKRG